jgi:hypothetical protein
MVQIGRGGQVGINMKAQKPKDMQNMSRTHFIRRSGMSVLLLAIVHIVLSPKAFAASLTTQQIIDLHSAGIGDAVIAQQVEANGITFDADSAALLTLKKAGLSDTVLGAVVRRSAAGASPSAHSTTSDPVRDLYKAQKYPEAADLLMGKVRANSATDREQAILVLALLKLDNLSAAKSQANLLATQVPTSSFVPQLAAVLAQAEEMHRLRAPVNDAIKRLNAKDLQSVIETSSLTESEKRDMLVDAAVVSANFEGAKQLISSSTSGSSYMELDRQKKRQQKLQVQETAFMTAAKDADRFIHSPASVSYCNGAHPDPHYAPSGIAGEGFTISAYLEAVRKIAELAPLNAGVLDQVFFATMISSKYDDVEAIGDRILSAVGRLRILGYSSDRFFTLVIDQTNGRLLTEPDEHPFAFAYGYGASGEHFVPFNLSFPQIRGLTQSAGGSFGGPGSGFGTNPLQLAKSAYAIKLMPSGMVPQYSLMAFLQCSMGQGAQEYATYNLGAYIQHVSHIDPKNVSLVKPSNEHKVAGATFASFLGVAGTALGVNGSSEVLQDVAHSQGAMSDAQKRRTEFSSAGPFSFSVAESPPVRELEGALSLTTDGPQ